MPVRGASTTGGRSSGPQAAPTKSPTSTGRPRGRPPISDRESEDDSEDGYRSAASRRSKRFRPIDYSKDLVVLHPKDDIGKVMGLSGSDLDEFIDALRSNRLDFNTDDHETGPIEPDVVVYTPSVSTTKAVVSTPIIAPTRTHSHSSRTGPTPRVDAKCRIKRLKAEDQSHLSFDPVHELRQNPSYFEYDADTDDEIFLDHIATDRPRFRAARSELMESSDTPSLSKEQFEIIMATLERELELARSFHAQQLSVRTQTESLETLLTDTESAMSQIRDVTQHFTSSGLNLKKSNKAVDISGHRIDASISKALDVLMHANSSITPSTSCDNVRLPLSPNPKGNGVIVHNKHESNEPSLKKTSGYLDDNPIGQKSNKDRKNGKRNHDEEDDDLSHMPPLYSIDELCDFVPWDRAKVVLRKVFPEYFSSVDIKNEPVTKGKSKSYILRREKIIADVYNYWLQRRSRSKAGFLRGFHVFMMENWKVAKPLSSPIYPVTLLELRRELTEARRALLAARNDLDRARLIMDLVRKREKVKKMMFRCASDFVDATAAAVATTSEAVASPIMSKKKMSGSSTKKTPSKLSEPLNEVITCKFHIDSFDYSNMDKSMDIGNDAIMSRAKRANSASIRNGEPTPKRGRPRKTMPPPSPSDSEPSSEDEGYVSSDDSEESSGEEEMNESESSVSSSQPRQGTRRLRDKSRSTLLERPSASFRQKKMDGYDRHSNKRSLSTKTTKSSAYGKITVPFSNANPSANGSVRHNSPMYSLQLSSSTRHLQLRAKMNGASDSSDGRTGIQAPLALTPLRGHKSGRSKTTTPPIVRLTRSSYVKSRK